MNQKILTSIEAIRLNPVLLNSLDEQTRMISNESASAAFHAAACCQNGPRHNCELNINA